MRAFKLLLISMVFSCAEPFQFNDYSEIKVLDGKVSSLEGRSYVKVFLVQENGQMIDLVDYSVKVVDLDGNEFPFRYDGDSLVRAFVPNDPSFTAQPDNSYKVEAMNFDGSLLESTFDAVPKGVEFDLAIGDTVVIESSTLNQVLTREGTTAIANLKLDDEPVFTRLEFEYFYRNLFTSDTVVVKKEDEYVLFSNEESNSLEMDVTVGVTTDKGRFFIMQSDFCASVADTLNIIENCDRTSCCEFRETWPTVFKIHLESLSPETFNFWSNVKVLSSNDGLVFDTFPFPLNGNVSCENCSEQVFGVFRSVSETVKTQTIDL